MKGREYAGHKERGTDAHTRWYVLGKEIRMYCVTWSFLSECFSWIYMYYLTSGFKKLQRFSRLKNCIKFFSNGGFQNTEVAQLGKHKA